MDGVPVPGVHGRGAGRTRTPTLLLEEGRSIGVDLAAHREGGADRQVCVLFLGRRIHEAPEAEVKGRGVLGMRFIGRGFTSRLQRSGAWETPQTHLADTQHH